MKYQDIVSKINDLHEILDNIEKDSLDLDSKSTYLEEYDRKLKEDGDKVLKKQEELKKLEDRLTEEKEYNHRIAVENRLRSDGLEKKLVEIKTLNEEYDKKKIELTELGKKIDQKMKMAKLLDERETYLKERESVVNKELAMSKERKDTLDWREQKIKEREDYLQRITSN